MTSPSATTAVLQQLVGGVWVDGDGPDRRSEHHRGEDREPGVGRAASGGEKDTHQKTALVATRAASTIAPKAMASA